MKILIISPHLDDAVLSCCDHIFAWKKKKYFVKIVTVFTHFGTNNSITSIKKRLSETGFTSCEEQEDVRKKEDIKAMEKLGVAWKHLDFIDAGYRTYKSKPIYPDAKSLFSGKISPRDDALSKNLEKQIYLYDKYEMILLPLGTGKHIDHVLVKKVTEKVFDKNKIYYYVDFPYALKLINWKPENVFQILKNEKSIKLMSDYKLGLLKIYSSQYPLFFKNKARYPEIIVSNEKKY